jgi:hypothetical protein
MADSRQPIWDGEKWVQPEEAETNQMPPSTEGSSPSEPETAPPEASRLSERLRAAIARRPLTSAAVSIALGLVIAAAIAAAIAIPNINDLTDERDSLSAQLAHTKTALQQEQSDRKAAQAVAARIRGQRDQIISAARDRADSMISSAKDKLSKLNGQVSATQDKLSSTQSQLESTQASLDQAQEIKAQSSFGNGTWQANVDFLPGTYQSDGGPLCYWEKLKGPSGGGLNNIIDNGGDNSQQIVSVDSPYFHTNGCGTWTKVG